MKKSNWEFLQNYILQQDFKMINCQKPTRTRYRKVERNAEKIELPCYG